jgi:hypothetical protein
VQTIFKTTPASHYTQIENTLLNDGTMPPKAKMVLIYLLSKPKEWLLRIGDIRARLGLGNHSARQALRWLQAAGHVRYERLKSGYTRWFVYATPDIKPPESPAISPQVENPSIEKQPVLVTQKTVVTLKPPPLAVPDCLPEPEAKPDSVVVKEALVYPPQLTPDQQKAARHVIKKCNPSLQQAVLTALACKLLAGSVKSPVAYLNGLITRANNGTFEAVAPKKPTALKPERFWRGFQETPKIDNAEYFKNLRERYGKAAENAVGNLVFKDEKGR